MMPPPSENKVINPDAPLVKWHVFESFDSAAECERAYASAEQEVQQAHPQNIPASPPDLFARMLLSACIATDDPSRIPTGLSARLASIALKLGPPRPD